MVAEEYWLRAIHLDHTLAACLTLPNKIPLLNSYQVAPEQAVLFIYEAICCDWPTITGHPFR